MNFRENFLRNDTWKLSKTFVKSSSLIFRIKIFIRTDFWPIFVVRISITPQVRYEIKAFENILQNSVKYSLKTGTKKV